MKHKLLVVTLLLVLLSSCSTLLIRYESSDGSSKLASDFSNSSAEEILERIKTLKQINKYNGALLGFDNADAQINDFISSDKPLFYLQQALDREYEALLQSPSTTSEDVINFILKAREYYEELNTLLPEININPFTSETIGYLLPVLKQEYNGLIQQPSTTEESIKTFLLYAKDCFSQVNNSYGFLRFVASFITAESTTMELDAIFSFVTESDDATGFYLILKQKLETTSSLLSQDSAIPNAIQKNRKIHESLSLFYDADTLKAPSPELVVVSSLFPDILADFTMRMDSEIHSKLTGCTSKESLDKVISEYSDYLSFEGNGVSQYVEVMDRIANAKSLKEMISIELSEKIEETSRGIINTKLDEFADDIADTIVAADGLWKDILESQYLLLLEREADTIKTESDGEALIEKLETTINDEEKVENFRSFIYRKYSTIIRERIKSAKSHKSLETIYKDFPSYLSSEYGSHLSDEINKMFAVFQEEETLFMEIVQADPVKITDLGELRDLNRKITKYKAENDADSASYNFSHMVAIQNIKMKTTERINTLSWLVSDKYNYIISMIDPAILDSPLYYGHRNQPYRPVGKTLRKIISQQSFLYVEMFITNDFDSWSDEIAGAYIDIDGKNDSKISFHLVLSKTADEQVLTIVNAVRNDWEGNTDFPEIKTYWDKFMDETIVSYITKMKNDEDQALASWLWLSSY